PLSPAAIGLLKDMHAGTQDDFIFAGERKNRPISNMSLVMLLRRMERDDATTHGFRATFRTWAAECTTFPPEVVEGALAHKVGGKLAEAYQRGDLFEKRRKLMDAWADFCAAKTLAPGEVVPLRAAS